MTIAKHIVCKIQHYIVIHVSDTLPKSAFVHLLPYVACAFISSAQLIH